MATADDGNIFVATFTPEDGGNPVTVRTREEDQDDFKVNTIGNRHMSVMANFLLDESQRDATYQQILMSITASEPGTYPLGEKAENSAATMQLGPNDAGFGDDESARTPSMKAMTGTLTIDAIDFENETVRGSFDGAFEQTDDGDSSRETMYRIAGSFAIDGKLEDAARRSR